MDEQEYSNEKKSGSGCLGTIGGAFFWIIVISFIITRCSGGNDSKKNTSQQTANTPQTTVSSPSNQNSSSTATNSGNNVATAASLSAGAQAIEIQYFHKSYVDYIGAPLHQFPKHTEMLEKLAEIEEDPNSAIAGAQPVKFVFKLIGDSYYALTSEDTEYYFIGGMKDNRPSGFGILLRKVVLPSSGSSFILFKSIGNFKNGMLDGYGIDFCAYDYDISPALDVVKEINGLTSEQYDRIVHYLVNHVIYEGEWKEGKRNGKGNEYEIAHVDGYFLLSGDVPYASYLFGPVYPFYVTKGEWKNNSLTGNVVMYVGSHLDYTGEMKDYKKTGKGTLYYYSGTIKYEGELVDGKPNGQGTSYDESGNVVYSGQWKHGDYAN